MNDEVIPLLKLNEYFQGASDETLEEVVRLGRVAQHPAGSIVHEADVVLTTVGLVLRGRLKAVRVRSLALPRKRAAHRRRREGEVPPRAHAQPGRQEARPPVTCRRA